MSLSSPFTHQPVHARKVTPEVACTVGGGHLLGIDHHWVALQRRKRMNQANPISKNEINLIKRLL